MYVMVHVGTVVQTFQYSCIVAPTEAPKPAPTKSCMSTVLCMLSCKTGYSLGATGSDGCQTCTCVARKYTSIALLHVLLLYLNMYFLSNEANEKKSLLIIVHANSL